MSHDISTFKPKNHFNGSLDGLMAVLPSGGPIMTVERHYWCDSTMRWCCKCNWFDSSSNLKSAIIHPDSLLFKKV